MRSLCKFVQPVVTICLCGNFSGAPELGMVARDPSTVDEWTTHVLNIQGAIFERWVAHVVRADRDWRLIETEYPVAYPLPGDGRPWFAEADSPG